MKMSSNFVLYSTIAGLFSSAFVLRIGFGLQAFYLIMVFNLFIMMLLKKLWLPPGLLAMFGFLLFGGLVGITRETDTPIRFLKEFSGIVLSSFYFCSFFKTMNFDTGRCFHIYGKVAFWVSGLGIILWPFQWFLLSSYRLRSVFAEPAAFAVVSLPALYYFANQWYRVRLCGKELLVMLVAFCGAQSSLGFIGIFFGLCIFGTRTRRGRLAIPGVLIALGLMLYTLSGDFALRVNDSVFSLVKSDVTGTNLSTYALFSNLFVMENVIATHPLLGNGLGSHGMSYRRYVGALPGVEEFSQDGFEGLNAEDGSSLAIRLLSDLGIVGAICVLIFLWRYKNMGETEAATVSKAVLVYFFVMLVRGGLYFSDEEFFFVLIYVLTASKRGDSSHRLVRYRLNRPSDLASA